MDNIDPDLLKNGEIFDFDLAANTYYFPIEDLILDNFQDFIDKKINGEFINLRKNFAKQEYQEVRNLAHKLKSVFSMLGAVRLHKCFEQIQKSIDNKDFDNIKEYYFSLVKEMNIFIKELQTFSNNVNYPISLSLIQKFNQLSKECDLNDNYNGKSLNKSEITSVTKNNAKNDENIIDLENGKVEIDKPIKNVCCDTGCSIF